MSTSDSIVSSQTKQSSWRKSDTTWTLGLFGTAIGAGVLFFPIRAGFGGLIPILLMLVLAYPIAFYCHRALARLCLSGSNPSGNITERWKSILVKLAAWLSRSCTSSRFAHCCGFMALLLPIPL